MIFVRDDFRIGLVISPRVSVLARGEAESHYSYPRTNDEATRQFSSFFCKYNSIWLIKYIIGYSSSEDNSTDIDNIRLHLIKRGIYVFEMILGKWNKNGQQIPGQFS